MIPLNGKLRLPPGRFGLFRPLNQQARKEVTGLTGVTDPDYRGEIGVLLHSGGKEVHVWGTGDPLGPLLVIPCPVIKVNGKQQHPNPGRTTNGPDHSGMKVWVTASCKEPQLAEVLAEGKGNTDLVAEEES